MLLLFQQVIHTFFVTQSAYGYLDSWRVMSDMAKAANLKRTELITSTRLRKYISTVAQVIDLDEGEDEWLTNHLGHDLEVHKTYYCLHESTVELSKVLLAVDSGCTAKFRGKSLKEVMPRAEPSDVKPNDSDTKVDSNADDLDDSLAATVNVAQCLSPHSEGSSVWAASQPAGDTTKCRKIAPAAVLKELKMVETSKHSKKCHLQDTDDEGSSEDTDDEGSSDSATAC